MAVIPQKIVCDRCDAEAISIANQKVFEVKLTGNEYNGPAEKCNPLGDMCEYCALELLDYIRDQFMKEKKAKEVKS